MTELSPQHRETLSWDKGLGGARDQLVGPSKVLGGDRARRHWDLLLGTHRSSWCPLCPQGRRHRDAAEAISLLHVHKGPGKLPLP